MVRSESLNWGGPERQACGSAWANCPHDTPPGDTPPEWYRRPVEGGSLLFLSDASAEVLQPLAFDPTVYGSIFLCHSFPAGTGPHLTLYHRSLWENECQEANSHSGAWASINCVHQGLCFRLAHSLPGLSACKLAYFKMC